MALLLVVHQCTFMTEDNKRTGTVKHAPCEMLAVNLSMEVEYLSCGNRTAMKQRSKE